MLAALALAAAQALSPAAAAFVDDATARLLAGEARIEALSAARVEVMRLPASGGGASGSLSLPVPVHLGRLHVDRLELAAAVAGTSAVLAVDVHGQSCLQAAALLHVSVDGLAKLRRRAYRKIADGQNESTD